MMAHAWTVGKSREGGEGGGVEAISPKSLTIQTAVRCCIDFHALEFRPVSFHVLMRKT